MKPLPAFIRDPAGFLAFVFRRWREDRCLQIAGSLTFTTLLALVPLFTVVVVVLSALPFFEDAMVQVKVFLLLNLVPEIAGKIITVYMGQFAEAAGRLTSVSLVALFVMAIAMLFTVDRSLNVIWRVERHRPLWLSVTGYVALLAFGPALMGLSLWASSWVVTASLDRLVMPSQLESFVLRAVPVAGTALAFFLVYRIIPNRHVPARHALAGGILAAVAFEFMKSAFAGYLRAVPAYRLVYGAFAALPIFMLWIYLSWLVVLFGAEFTASLAWWRGRRWRGGDAPQPGLEGAFEIGRALATAGGEPVEFATLRQTVDLPDERLEDILRDLVQTGAVRRSRKGWALASREGNREAPP
ncbi:MAG: YihY family inner membrane protein [Betaproteobacteria bacterium]|nr:YihY family inner membrane protein [Betaproteobacteria bacterium]